MHFLPGRLAACLLTAVLGLLATGCATGNECDPRYAASPQIGGECRFRNMPNPQALPSESGWKIWSRFLTATKEGTVPVDPIPVRKLDRAALDALDPVANHVVRLGHSSHLLKLHGKYWLIDPVFSERASPVAQPAASRLSRAVSKEAARRRGRRDMEEARDAQKRGKRASDQATGGSLAPVA